MQKTRKFLTFFIQLIPMDDQSPLLWILYAYSSRLDLCLIVSQKGPEIRTGVMRDGVDVRNESNGAHCSHIPFRSKSQLDMNS